VHVEVEVAGPLLCLMQVYGPNASALYLEFWKKSEISDDFGWWRTG